MNELAEAILGKLQADGHSVRTYGRLFRWAGNHAEFEPAADSDRINQVGFGWPPSALPSREWLRELTGLIVGPRSPEEISSKLEHLLSEVKGKRDSAYGWGMGEWVVTFQNLGQFTYMSFCRGTEPDLAPL